MIEEWIELDINLFCFFKINFVNLIIFHAKCISCHVAAIINLNLKIKLFSSLILNHFWHLEKKKLNQINSCCTYDSIQHNILFQWSFKILLISRNHLNVAC